MAPIPVTIITGFLGSGKTTLILNLIPQLPQTYRLALLKNEFGDVAIDSQLASSSAISGVRELLNGCICCNLVGQLGDALETLRIDVVPDRIVIETSGSAFPATLAMEINRLASETGHYALDGVIVAIDVENWEGYEDTSYTAKMQARYTDLIVFNKWELVDERRFDDCLDRVGDLELDIPWMKSDRGFVSKDVLLGMDKSLASSLVETTGKSDHSHSHEHHEHGQHQSEVEVLSITMAGEKSQDLDLEKFQRLLESASKEEIYRMKAILRLSKTPQSSPGQIQPQKANGNCSDFILNWAFGRWTFTSISSKDTPDVPKLPTPPESGTSTPSSPKEVTLRMTVISARYEANKWKKRLEDGNFISFEDGPIDGLVVERVL